MSAIRGWEVSKGDKSYVTSFLSENDRSALPRAGFVLTPLVAAPPEGAPSYGEFCALANEWMANADRLYEESFRYGSDGVMGRSYADAQRRYASALCSPVFPRTQ